MKSSIEIGAYRRELRDAQLAYTHRHWATIELRPPIAAAFSATDDERRRATRPLVKGWPDHAIDPRYTVDDRVERIVRVREVYPSCGIGRVMGPQLDDRYHVAFDEDVDGALSALAAQHGGTITPTWRQIARRGHHYVYVLTSRQALIVDLLHGRGGALHVRLDGIDVLGARRYVVAAPSTHRDGTTRYAVVDDGDPTELPDWLWRAVVAARDQRSNKRIEHDDPELADDEIDRRWPYAYRLHCAERLAVTHAPAIQGQRGWPTTMLLVGAIVTGLAVGRDDTIEIVTRIYSPRCMPPWSRDEIAHMVTRAIECPYRARGWLLNKQRSASAWASADATARGGESGGGAAAVARAEIVCVDERPGHGAAWFQILDGDHAGERRRRPLAWPVTDRSHALWSALARAVGLDAITHPDAQLRGRVVRVVIVGDPSGAYAWRLGRVYPIA